MNEEELSGSASQSVALENANFIITLKFAEESEENFIANIQSGVHNSL